MYQVSKQLVDIVRLMIHNKVQLDNELDTRFANCDEYFSRLHKKFMRIKVWKTFLLKFNKSIQLYGLLRLS